MSAITLQTDERRNLNATQKRKLLSLRKEAKINRTVVPTTTKKVKDVSRTFITWTKKSTRLRELQLLSNAITHVESNQAIQHIRKCAVVKTSFLHLSRRLRSHSSQMEQDSKALKYERKRKDFVAKKSAILAKIKNFIHQFNINLLLKYHYLYSI